MRFLCVIGGRRSDRREAAARRAAERGDTVAAPVAPARWPFERHVVPASVPEHPCTILIPDLHLAFPSGQTPGTRLVLTQSTYQLQRWLDWLEHRPHVTVVAHASRAALTRGAPETGQRRGPWHALEVVELEGDDEPGNVEAEPIADGMQPLVLAFAADNASGRLQAAARAAEREPDNPALHLAVASAFMELDQLQPAQDALERAAALAPSWEAVPFEYGKLWLRADDVHRAADRFAEAAHLMPTFAAALSNLGATLGETDRQEPAIDALTQALRYDPNGYTILNNLSVLYREQGRLDEAIEAARRVMTLSPDFVFGYYNLAHALFLQGQFAAARDAYENGHRRDPQKNPVQGCRLAVARAAAGDPAGAVEALHASADALAPESRRDVLEESEEILRALLALPGASAPELQRVIDMVREKKKPDRKRWRLPRGSGPA